MRIQLLVLICLSLLSMQLKAEDPIGPNPPRPEVAIGRRLFLETRFAQLFAVQCNGDVNATDISGDPVLQQTATTGAPLPGAFAGKTMNCRACHMEDEHAGEPGGGIRTYADFARRTPIPMREDGKTVTTRNTPSLVRASNPRQFFFLHFDAEFATAADLAIGGFTGRNFGWLPSEYSRAVKHIVKVIREDNGQGELAQQFGGSYRDVLAGAPTVPPQFLLPKEFRLDVTHSPDQKILAAVGKLVAAYLQTLDFRRDQGGAYSGSPYDLFLIRNNLPRKPDVGESPRDYSRRLRDAVNALTNPVFIGLADGQFRTHPLPFVFGPEELTGMKLFFAEPTAVAAQLPPPPPPPGQNPPPPPPPPQGIGNCIACHVAPEFTDFNFHNTGVTQLEYDNAHGVGSFEALGIPKLADRKGKGASVLPATPKHPNNSGIFRAIATPERAGETDLGLWNVYGNLDFPKPQQSLKLLASQRFPGMTQSAVLDQTIALFKTPGLRDLGHSGPYQHNGSLDTLSQVMRFYAQTANLARQGHLRNGDPAMNAISLSPEQAEQIVKFMNALNEDFED